MKKIIYSFILVALASAMVACGAKDGIRKGNPISGIDSLSYCLGANIGNGIAMQMEGVTFDFETMTEGLKDGALDKASQTQDESVEVLRNYFTNRFPEIKKTEQENLEKQLADSTAVVEPVEYFNDEKERHDVSYAFGNDIGSNLREAKLPLYLKSLVSGFSDAVNKTIELSDEQIQNYLQNYFMVERPKIELEKSEKWLKKMERKSGVEKTESGLLYKVIEQGDMSLAATSDDDVVKVNYEGKTMEGKVFDSSYERNEPIEFPLSGVIKGWTEGMKLIGPGGKIILYIPSELAYGERGAGRDIGPNAALEFTVELLEVNPKAEEAAAETAEETPAEPAK